MPDKPRQGRTGRGCAERIARHHLPGRSPEIPPIAHLVSTIEAYPENRRRPVARLGAYTPQPLTEVHPLRKVRRRTPNENPREVGRIPRGVRVDHRRSENPFGVNRDGIRRRGGESRSNLGSAKLWLWSCLPRCYHHTRVHTASTYRVEQSAPKHSWQILFLATLYRLAPTAASLCRGDWQDGRRSQMRADA